jgi:hypothetical protein
MRPPFSCFSPNPKEKSYEYETTNDLNRSFTCLLSCEQPEKENVTPKKNSE